MKQILIKFEDEFSDEDALKYILSVVKEGKISKTSKGEQYCFISVFDGGVRVHAASYTKHPTFAIYRYGKS